MPRAFEERLFRIMDQKDHWAWPSFGRPGLSRNQLLVHFRHEYQTYVRDFPVLLARALGLGPPADVRAALAENIFEEQTGKLSLGVSHPALFLEMMEGLGFSESDLEAPNYLEPEAIAYRRYLDDASAGVPWQIGVAVLTIFVEGSKLEREEMAGRREVKPVEVAIAEHPLVKIHGCPIEKMRLIRAHRSVESGHRGDAWRMVLGHVDAAELEDGVVAGMQKALDHWLSYRDGVARRAGLVR